MNTYQVTFASSETSVTLMFHSPSWTELEEYLTAMIEPGETLTIERQS